MKRLKINNQQSRLPNGFTLIELVITIMVLSVLALGTVPLVQNAVRRQKEQQLRETLREIRLAIDEFHRDANGPCTQGNLNGSGYADPRQRVSISDCKIFEASKENPDRYPPSLTMLVEGVEVAPRNSANNKTTRGSVFGDTNGATGDKANGATGGDEATEPKKKFYLRQLPVDPITGEPFDDQKNCRSSVQEKDEEWDGNNVFDVHSEADGETLDGIKYKDL